MKLNRIGRVAMAAMLLVNWLFPSHAWAWGKQGHRIVGQIAESRLTPKARAAVEKLLGEGKRLSDDDVANWADFVRGEFPETGPWHYVDIPVDTGVYDPARDCRFSDCVIDRIERFREVLADPKAKQNERQRALKFLVHLVGDMHQPLHCAERRDSQGNPDHGGNLCVVLFLEEPNPSNLHKVWDTQIIEHSLGGSDPLQYGEGLAGRIDPKQAENWREGTVRDWAIESNRLAAGQVYRGVAPDGTPTRLDAKYVSRGKSVVDRQLTKAGVRLAEILNQTFPE